MKKAIGFLVLIVVLSSLAAWGFAEPLKVDLDLSVMPASIAYAQALAMQREPDDYLGMTMRIGGIFNYSEARQCGVIIIADNTGCCETSMDFSCAGDMHYPGDYPDLYAKITIVGVFSPDGNDESIFRLSDVVIESP